MDKLKLAELKKTADGTYQFRLLSQSLPQIKLEEVSLTLKDMVFAFIADSNGIMNDVPEARVSIQVGDQTVNQDLTPQQSITIKGWNITFLYALDGEISGLPMQSTAHFRLKRI
jgi:hypothetical protein